jgi:predicted short-subunit dehydrogenase-like oxidoreductase (DUF2520 family)
MEKALAIVGAGRVGRSLGRRLRENGWKIHSVVTRSEASARESVRFIEAGNASAAIARQIVSAPAILICVPDDAIQETGEELARIGGEELRGKPVLHTSGARASDALDVLRICGAAVGSMHPLQSFSGVGVPPLEGKIFAIEGDGAAVRVARQMTRSLGGTPMRIAAAKKPLYHATGALAAGLVLAMEEAGVQMAMTSGMKRHEAVRALLCLTRQVLEHYEQLGPRKAWTGPLSRRDYRVVAAHEEALREFCPEFLGAYRATCQLAARVLAGDPDSMLKRLETISQTKEFAAQNLRRPA